MRKKADFFSDNPDLDFHLRQSGFLQELYALTSTQDRDAVAASTAEEYEQAWLQALASFGEVVGSEVAPHTRQVEDEKLSVDELGNLQPGPQLAANIKLLYDMGIAPFTSRTEWGGLGAPFMVQCSMFELLFRACPSTALNVIWHGTVAEVIEIFGNAELKQRYVPKLSSGEWSGCMVLTEAGAGSDLAALTAYAEQQDDGNWHLYGSKRFITNGAADVALVLANTSKGRQGLQHLSLFVAPRLIDGKPNYQVARLEDKLGLAGSATCDLNFDGSQAQLLGEADKGFSYMLLLMNGARIVTGFQGVGTLEAVYRLATSYASERRTWGKKIAEHELIADKLLDMEMDLKAIRSLVYKAAFRQSFIDMAKTYLAANPDLDHELRHQLEHRMSAYRRRIRQWIPLIKYQVGENVVMHARNALQIHGGYGYSREYLPELWLRQSVILSLYEGTSQIQALMCVKDLLKGVLRNPRAFIERTLALNVKGISESSKLRKKLNKAKQLVNSATVKILLTLIGKNFASGVSQLRMKDLLRGLEKLKKNIKLRDFSHALLNSERLCEMKCRVALAEALVWDAEADSTREKTAHRFLDKAIPRLQGLKAEIEASNTFLNK